MNNLAEAVGHKIRYYRKSRGLTQEQLGERVQQPQSYIGGIERGEKNISLDTLEKISRALEVHPTALFENYSMLITKDKIENDKLIVGVTSILQGRTAKEIQVLSKLIKDVVSVFDSK
ncbi:helix-turn-helix domain-containing protein [Cohnella sp. JJ-181]|uniref:helix-turn-helix domain-containing protein n=1 Tax=Cohnella rhizoplanae TaxID=2974897 RepID=UPI00232FB67E|nr:helix-turn-helix transcriptional regulator [Cohnella sp. JJ-181]